MHEPFSARRYASPKNRGGAWISVRRAAPIIGQFGAGPSQVRRKVDPGVVERRASGLDVRDHLQPDGAQFGGVLRADPAEPLDVLEAVLVLPAPAAVWVDHDIERAIEGDDSAARPTASQKRTTPSWTWRMGTTCPLAHLSAPSLCAVVMTAGCRPRGGAVKPRSANPAGIGDVLDLQFDAFAPLPVVGLELAGHVQR